MSSNLFRPIYSEHEILLLRIEEGLQTQRRWEEEIKREKESLGSVKTLPVLNLDTDLVQRRDQLDLESNDIYIPVK